MAIRGEHIRQIVGDCMDILRKMPEFHWWTYEAELRKRGYEVRLNRDSMNEVRGYTIKMGNQSDENAAGRPSRPAAQHPEHV